MTTVRSHHAYRFTRRQIEIAKQALENAKHYQSPDEIEFERKFRVLYAQNLNDVEMGVHLGMNQATVLRWRKRFNLPPQSKGGGVMGGVARRG
jgi:hypothetical protein